ncbi:hypothetical protein ElyMa_006996500 [Elysia marginata]|uniref:Uncharacterized protein n=1 Tax=Elysia marginata TaxID=1093978 RepID=A0AAV4JN41_9GAST|nr:hypothetical protein ElyMa_006996500 [Elysia marginata]
MSQLPHRPHPAYRTVVFRQDCTALTNRPRSSVDVTTCCCCIERVHSFLSRSVSTLKTLLVDDVFHTVRSISRTMRPQQFDLLVCNAFHMRKFAVVISVITFKFSEPLIWRKIFQTLFKD